MIQYQQEQPVPEQRGLSQDSEKPMQRARAALRQARKALAESEQVRARLNKLLNMEH